MRRFIAPIIALWMAWAMPLAALAQSGGALPPVRMVSIGEPVFELFDRKHGLQSTQLFEVKSDPHGFIWAAGDRGIHRFDGHTFFDLDRDPTRNDSLESRYNYLVAPSSDAMWIVAPNATLQILDSTTGKLTRLAVKGVSLKDIEWLDTDARGRFWYLSPEGVVRVDRDGNAMKVAPPALRIAFNPDRTRMFAVYADHVAMIDTLQPSKIATVLTLPKDFQGPISTMVSDPDGLWLSVDEGIWRFDLKAGTAQFVKMPMSLALITSLVWAGDGSLWFGGFDGLLYRYASKEGALSVFGNNSHDPQSLPRGGITGMTIDRGNTVWIAMSGTGLVRLRLSQTMRSHYRIRGGDRICALNEIDSRRLVLGLCPGGVVEVDRQTGQQRPLQASTVMPERSRAIARDGEGGLWITSLREGLIHWRPDGSARRYFLKGRESRHLLMSGIYVDDRKRVWVTHLRGLSVLEPGAEELRSVGGDQFYIVNDVSKGPSGTLWLGTVGGLVNFDPETGQTRRYAHDRADPTTLSDNDVVQAYTDKQGRLWVGTRAGLNRLTTDSKGRPVFKRYGLAQGLPDITIASLVNDDHGGLWVGTYRGIARWDPKADRFQSYLPGDGLPDSDIYAKAILPSMDGSLYLGTWSGLWRVDPQTIHLADPVPVVLSGYEVGNRATINLMGKRLPGIEAEYSDSRVAFRIAVLGDARRLSYRLEGLEDTWRDMPADLNISYHRLPPGSYSLQIRQLQRDGSWGLPELSLPIEITPPFWRTTWAYLLYAIAIAAFVIASARAFMAWRQRELREQLKESNARLTMALRAAGFGMWAWDVSNYEVELDADARQILAVRPDAQPVADVFARMHPEDLVRVRELIGRALQDDTPVNFEFRLTDGDSGRKWRWIEGHALPYRRPGKAAYVIGVNRDATQRKHELLELEQSREEAQKATEAKGRFLAMMSHEIRTPIGGVIGMVELLFETPMSQEQQQLLGVCKDSAYTLLTIINDILDFSKIEAGKLKLEYTPFSPRRLVESVGESLRTQVARKGIDLDVFVAHDVPRRLLGDRVRLRQILTNLMANAVKFTEKGGVRVYVTVAPEPVCNGHRKQQIRFDVLDTGIGMDRRTLDTLFEPFEQADAATTRRFGGTGLGLTIVKHLVEIMGGSIDCNSEVASGSRFGVTIPMEAIAVDSGKDAVLPDALVLALCESPERAVLLQELCADFGARIDISRSFDRLLQRIDELEAEAAQHCLVLLDKGFSEDHDALCRTIRLQAKSATMPIIVVRPDSLRSQVVSVPGVTTVAGSPLTSRALARSLQLALGLVSPEVPAVATESNTVPLAGTIAAEAEILLAEDNATNREVITRQLQRLGYACDVAEDGEQAWQLLRTGRYRLLLTDCHMPRLDGYGLTDRIRRSEAAAGSPRLNIVAITANALLGEGERCLAAGMDAYLTKPLQMPDLTRVLARMLPGAAASVAMGTPDAPVQEAEVGFPLLTRVVGNDEAKLRRLLDTFVSGTLADLDQWTKARHADDCDTLRRLAHKLKSGCRQLGENAAAAAFESVELHSGTLEELLALADFALVEIKRTLERVAAFRNRVLVQP